MRELQQIRNISGVYATESVYLSCSDIAGLSFAVAAAVCKIYKSAREMLSDILHSRPFVTSRVWK